jgi:signal transduction histidine kinase
MSLKQRVLIVDDSPSVLKILNNALHNEYQVSVATNGEDALVFAGAQNPDLILLDIKMPGIDGYEVCRRLKQNKATRDIPILFVTILSEIEDETKGLEMDAVDYITKPISPAIVQARVRNHMRLKMYQDRLEELVCERTREVVEARARAEQANQVKNEFIVNISHEIRSPMNSILGMTDLVLETELTKKQREYLKIVDDSATQLFELLTDLLDFSKIETGKLDIEPDDFSPHHIFNSMLRVFRAKAENKGLGFNWRIDPSIPDALRGDPDRLRQVLNNLLDNALRFTWSGSIELECSLAEDESAASVAADSVTLKFSVKDSGIGVPADQLELIFDGFYQVDGSLTRAQGGAGVGLSINKKLVEMMGGRIWVESVPGQGSCFSFTVRLPRSLPAPLVEPRVADGIRVLVAEDIQANLFLFQLILENIGCQVTGVENGRLALAALEKETFDLILMDIQMPEMDGITATRAIRNSPAGRWNPQIPIIALTAHAQAGDQQKFLEAGMDDYLAKPFRSNILAEKIKRLLMSKNVAASGGSER